MYTAGGRYTLEGLSVAVFRILAPMRERRRVSDVEQAPVAVAAGSESVVNDGSEQGAVVGRQS
jgi:hypothetical protein